MAVYVIRAKGTDFYKIGTSTDPYQRMVAMQIGSPYELEVVCSVDGDLLDEDLLHRSLRSHHVRGEWFKLDDCPTEEMLCQLAGEASPSAPLMELVTTGSIGLMLGIPRVVAGRFATQSGFPDPVARVDGHNRVWDRADIERWAHDTGRTK